MLHGSKLLGMLLGGRLLELQNRMFLIPLHGKRGRK
jgi:hypothetical protein